MPGYTPVLGIPYPLLGETVDPTIFASFANAVDSAMTTHRARRDAAMNRTPYLRLVPAFPQTFVINTDQTLLWDTAAFIDTDGLYSPGSPGVAATIKKNGLYMITSFRNHLDGGFATLVSFRVMIKQNGIVRAAERRNENGNSSGTPDIMIATVLPCLVGDQLSVTLAWQGTGGPANLFNAAFQLRYICPLTSA